MERQAGDLLSQWQSYITNISSNLMELSEQTEYQLIKAKAADNKNGYTGLTKVKADKCVETMGILWQQFVSLSEVIEKANVLNSKHSFLFNAEEAVKELLENTLIVVESQHVDINQRSLLGGENNEKKATPKELLKQMQEAFESVRRDIKEISEAEESLQSRLDAAKADIAQLTATVKKFGITSIPTFYTVRIAAVENDPLQGAVELDRLVYSIEKYRGAIKSVKDEYTSIEDALNRVRDMLTELRDLSEKSKLAYVESQKLFVQTVVAQPGINDEVLNSLQDWLKVLEKKLNEGLLNAVKVGVTNLEKECTAKLLEERKYYEAISKDYNEWLDLKGQFKALLVKADILKTKGLLVEESLDEIIKDTKAVLYAVPVNIDSCRKMVRKFERNL